MAQHIFVCFSSYFYGFMSFTIFMSFQICDDDDDDDGDGDDDDDDHHDDLHRGP